MTNPYSARTPFVGVLLSLLVFACSDGGVGSPSTQEGSETYPSDEAEGDTLTSGGATSVGNAPGTGGNPLVDGGTGGGATGGVGSGGLASGGTGGTVSNDPVFHIFVLAGQSNMAGVAQHEPGDQNTDERLQVWGGHNKPSNQWNLANPPLHDAGEKMWNPSNAVGPGMWFAKTIADALPPGHSAGMVAVSESGQSINTFISGGIYHNAIMNKIAAVRDTDNARFSGIIFHQGESDSGQSDWPGKVVQFYGEVKNAFGVDYDVPMILGELPASGCCGGHNGRVHEAAEMLPLGDWVSQEGTNVLPDGLHFDHASVVLMGQRYGDAMIEALGW